MGNVSPMSDRISAEGQGLEGGSADATAVCSLREEVITHTCAR